MIRLLASLLVTCALAASASAQSATPSPNDEPAKPQPEAATVTPAPAKAAALSKKGMAVAANPYAVEAANAILAAGGNAVDAAIAAQMVLNVVEPQSSGIGGGGFLLYYDLAANEVTAYDGREKAPLQAKPGLFLKPDGQPMAFMDAVANGKSIATPGLLAMLSMVHAQRGKLPWKDLFTPAILLAADGFALPRRMHQLMRDNAHLQRSAARQLIDADPDSVKPGDSVTNKALASTLQAIADSGADQFYHGFATDIANAVANHPGGKGLLKTRDLLYYQAVERPPLCDTYRDYTICGMGPPSSGGFTLLQALKLLEGFNLQDRKPYDPEAVHLMLEAEKLAFADRNRYLADRDYIDIPVTGLLDPSYISERARLIRPEKASAVSAGTVGNTAYAPSRGAEGPSTTHISIVDEAGNAVALTSSIEHAFGSGVAVDGFLLNNQMTDFAFIPFESNQMVANQVEPGKRPRSSMAPTLVFDKGGKLVMVLGSPGGARIIPYVLKTLIAVLDWNMPLQAAIDAPNVLDIGEGVELEPSPQSEALAVALRGKGHTVTVTEQPSGLHAILLRSDGTREGAADPRREGIARGEMDESSSLPLPAPANDNIPNSAEAAPGDKSGSSEKPVMENGPQQEEDTKIDKPVIQPAFNSPSRKQPRTPKRLAQ